MRLFIALDICKEVRSHLSSLQKQLPDSESSLAVEFHLTLKFLGEVDDKQVPGIISCLRDVRFSKFTARTGGLGVFPSEKMVRVVWVGLEPEDKISALQKSISSVLPDFADDHEFHPHITLSRIKFVKNKSSFIKKLKSIKTKEIEFEVSAFKLIKSNLMPEGPVHEVIAEFQSQPL
jgi:2'-5' RNA ligase